MNKQYKQQITHVYLFRNGMVLVFDQYGKQMPKFQGRQTLFRKKIEDRIKRQANKYVEWVEQK